jgi:hypothetical protein
MNNSRKSNDFRLVDVKLGGKANRMQYRNIS